MDAGIQQWLRPEPNPHPTNSSLAHRSRLGARGRRVAANAAAVPIRPGRAIGIREAMDVVDLSR